MTAELAPVSAIILAGGRAARFQGEDKGLIELAGRPLVVWVARCLSQQVDEILVSANRGSESYAALGFEIVRDTMANFPGPIAGFAAAGKIARNDWLLTAPCDCPFLPADLVRRMLEVAVARDLDLVRAADASGVHYAVMLARRAMLAEADGFLAAGGHQVRAWQARYACENVHFDGDPPRFFNINTPGDLSRAGVDAGGQAMNPAQRLLVGLIRVYQVAISPFIGSQCRFTPTCSHYAREAVARHGAIKGSWLALRRIARCHPWHPGGHDPVP